MKSALIIINRTKLKLNFNSSLVFELIIKFNIGYGTSLHPLKYLWQGSQDNIAVLETSTTPHSQTLGWRDCSDQLVPSRINNQSYKQWAEM